jgi:hypothetical protein
MNVFREIVDWAQNLPPWQADAVRRLLVHGEFDENDKREVLAMLRREYHLLSDGEKAPLTQKPSRGRIGQVGSRSTATAQDGRAGARPYQA